eukprot:m.49417 g.49417  ORF g.49417 m.49417 type:complete len:236 (-) comp10615_c0_seq4:77-784(-)
MYDDPGQEKGEAAVADEGDGGLYDEPAFNQDDRENPMYQSQDHVEDGDGGGYLDVQPDGEDDDENDDDEDFDDDEDEDEDYDDDDDDDDEDEEDYVPPEIEDDGTDKSKLKEHKIRESVPVHCPLFPEVKEECWFVFLAMPRNDTCVTQPIKVFTLKDETEEEVELVFQTPPVADTYAFTLFVVSDSYDGVSFEEKVEMVVKKGPEQAEVEDIVSEEDSDALSDEDDSGDESDDF